MPHLKCLPFLGYFSFPALVTNRINCSLATNRFSVLKFTRGSVFWDSISLTMLSLREVDGVESRGSLRYLCSSGRILLTKLCRSFVGASICSSVAKSFNSLSPAVSTSWCRSCKKWLLSNKGKQSSFERMKHDVSYH